MNTLTLRNFYYHPRILSYDFGAQHPLKPERLRRTILLLEQMGVECVDPGPGAVEDVLRVHFQEYVDIVSHADELDLEQMWQYGFSPGDTPPFKGMFQASLAYTAGSVAAANDVKNGAPLAYNISGGLHHAQRSNASGFCVFNDPAVAVNILRERFERVAYVDIDVHHGDGVQAIFYDDPTVLTCSIHQDGRTLYPGTGFVEEIGAQFSSINVPLLPRTTGDVWFWAFENGILPALERFKPEAIVLQMGTDTHDLDPLANIQNTAQEWLKAVISIRDFGVPIVAMGGGGYNLATVPRMWVAACLTLAGYEVPEYVAEPYRSEWSMPKYFDESYPEPREQGRQHAEKVVRWLESNVFEKIAG